MEKLNKEQKQDVIDYLKRKNLPLDLLLEVKDHMVEQLYDELENNNVDFDVAWRKVQQTWSQDLEFVTFNFGKRRITKFQKRIVNKTNSNIFWQTCKVVIAPVLLSLLLMLINKDWAYYWTFLIYSVVFCLNIWIVLKNFKIVKNKKSLQEKNISFLQNANNIVTLSIIYIPMLVLVNFEERFTKLYNAFSNILNWNASINDILTFVTYYFFLIFGIYGFLSFKKYRKQINYLEQRINFKL